MANILYASVVDYVCACGHLNPITKLYFCRYCLKLRCGFCVCHEVDSHFCSNCLENIPSSEAKLKKNRCNKCFDCPSCQHTLSSRAITVALPRKQDDEEVKKPASSDQNKQITRKMYYLYCLACRWSSRDVGIPDQTAANGPWPELEYAHATRFSLLLEHYQNVILQEKQERQDFWRRKAPKSHKFPSLSDRTGLTVSMVRRSMGWSDKSSPKIKQSTINPSVATDEVIPLPPELFTDQVNLSNITTLKQRLNNPSVQPFTVNNLYPQHKGLSIKRSLRCRQCEHNVIKPEFNPTSIKYRIQLFATYHVPEVRLVNCDPMNADVTSKFYLKIINPTMHDMNITIMDLPTREEESLIIEEMKKKYDKQTSLTSLPQSLSASFSRQASLTEEPKYVDKEVTGIISLPDSSFSLLHRDDTTEFDEDVPTKERDDPKFVVWRRSNQVIIELQVTPQHDLKPGGNVVAGFSMQYTYVNMAVGSDKKDPQRHALTARIYIRLGQTKTT